MSGRTERDSLSSIIDDEENSLDFIDSLDDDDDDPFGGRTPSAGLHAAKAVKKVPSPPEDESYSRIKYYRAMQSFQQAFTESSPLYIGERNRHPELSEKELQAKIGSLCKAHLKLVDRCLEINEADADDIMLKYQRRSLAKNIAALYLQSPISHIEGLVEVTKQWVAESDDFNNTGSDYNSSDNLLNIKLALFTGGLRSQVNLAGLWCSYTPSEVVSNLQNMAISLAKEVAYNWSKRSNISDRENLFISTLPYCLDIAEISYKDTAVKLLPQVKYLISDPDMRLPAFELSLDEADMGYIGESKSQLISRVREVVVGYINNSDRPALSASANLKWNSVLAGLLDNILAQCWGESVNNLMNKLSDMDQASRVEYASKHDKMDLEFFFDLLGKRIDSANEPLSDIEVDFDQVLDRARRHLAWVWGVSDSLISARKEGAPEGV